MKKLIIGLSVLVLTLSAAGVQAKGGGGGGRASSGARSYSSSSSRSSTSTRSVTSTPKATSAPKVVTPKVTTRPTSATKTVTAAKPKTVAGKTYSTKGSVVDKNYQPKFNGYTAPIGSTVYYRQSSMLDWLPLYLILSNQQHREAVVTQPDGKEQVVKEEGIDTMYVINWIVTILFALGLIGLIVWFVNKKTNYNY